MSYITVLLLSLEYYGHRVKGTNNSGANCMWGITWVEFNSLPETELLGPHPS